MESAALSGVARWGQHGLQMLRENNLSLRRYAPARRPTAVRKMSFSLATDPGLAP